MNRFRKIASDRDRALRPPEPETPAIEGEVAETEEITAAE